MNAKSVVFLGKDEVSVRPEPVRRPEANEILVRAEASLISTGTECICLGRLFSLGTHWDQWVKNYPFFPGYSLVGEVVAVGEGVTRFRGLERVAVRCGHRAYGTSDAARAIPVPRGLPAEQAAWFAMAVIAQNAVRKAEHRLGESVAVIGLGQLGQLVVQYARLLGARHVIAVDTSERRLEMALAHGATQTVCGTSAEAIDPVREETSGGPEIVYDVTGNSAVLPDALRMARRFGRVMILGDTGSPEEQRLTPDVIRRGIRVVGTHDSDPPLVSTDHAFWNHEEMAKLFFAYLKRGDMRVDDLITHRLRPEEAPEAYAMLRSNRSEAMGVVFDWT